VAPKTRVGLLRTWGEHLTDTVRATQNTGELRAGGAARGMRIAYWALAAAFLMVVAARVLGPSDVYDKEQPRTTSYTADMISNGHWVLPYDTFGIPATKPPLYNWLTAPFVQMGGYREWALKMPSLLGAAGALVVLIMAGRHLGRAEGKVGGWALGAVAASFWIATAVTVKLMYLARPDMVLVALLAGAWLAATMLLDRLAEGMRGAAVLKPAAAFWLCTLGAALDKGPLALFGLIYLVLAALVIHRRAGLLAKTGWWWGLPLVLGPMGVWSYFAYRQEPEFFQQVLLGRETAGRVAGAGRFFKTFFNGPAYVVTRFLPWSLLAIAGLALLGPRRWLRGSMAPAVLWLLIWGVVFSFASTKRPDRYAPVYPAVAVLAAYSALVLIPRLKAVEKFARLYAPGRMAALAFLVAAGWCVHSLWFSDMAKEGYATNAIAFARAVRQQTHGEPVLFLDGEQTPLEGLLGNVQADPPPRALQESATWVVRFVRDPEKGGGEEAGEGGVPVAVSGLIDQVDGPLPGKLGLYRVAPGEGVKLYERWERIPVRFVDDSNTVGTTAEARKRWVQFWRLHSAMGQSPATAPAAAASTGPAPQPVAPAPRGG
jgi:4-amino-4-deoxy-L-arabinose transferase-like glycosyltransferase